MKAQRIPLPDANGAIRWFQPDEDLSAELVLSGPCRERIDRLARELRATERFLAAGIDPSTRVLFEGPSGTGKTLAARWLGWELRLPVGVIDVAASVGTLLGETSGNLAAAFKVAADARAILFLDEVDAVCSRREAMKGGAAAAELQRATTTLLQQLDWLAPARIVIAATNFADAIDVALRRRLTTEITFDAPTREARRRMLGQWLARAPFDDSELDELADRTEGLSGASLRGLAMARAREKLLEQPDDRRASSRRRNGIAKGSQAVLDALGGAP